jgi:hypothetical protein
MTGTRAWELGVGAVFSVLAASKVRIFPRIDLKHMHWTATAVLFLSLAFVTERNFGFTLLVPVFAAGLFVYSTSNDLNPSREWRGIICNRFLLFVGKISFSLYLWHFPLYIAAKEKWQDLSISQFFQLACATFIISTLSFKYIEKPFISGRFSAKLTDKNESNRDTRKSESRLMYPAVVIAVVLFISAAPNFAQNVSIKSESVDWVAPDLEELFPGMEGSNFSPESQALNAGESTDQMTSEKWSQIVQTSAKDGSIPSETYKRLAKISQEFNPYEVMCFEDVPLPCTIYNPPIANKTVLLLGDSRMLMLLPPIVEAFKRKGNWKVINWSIYNCPVIPFEGEKNLNSDCLKRQAFVDDNLKSLNPDLVIVSERMHGDTLYYKQLVEFFKQNGIIKKVLPIIPFGYLETAPESCISNDGSYRIACFKTASDTNRKLFLLSGIFKNAQIPYFNFQNILCTASLLCPPVIQDVYVYRDTSHINSRFAETITDIVAHNIYRNSPVDLD